MYFLYKPSLDLVSGLTLLARTINTCSSRRSYCSKHVR